MTKTIRPGSYPLYLRRLIRFQMGLLALVGLAGICLGSTGDKNPDFLIESWQDHEGLPESSALDVAQAPDGYIWVGSNEGLLRFNGVNFLRAEKFSDLKRLSSVISFLQTDHSGRLWASGEGRLSMYEHGMWRGISGTNYSIRSVDTDSAGRSWFGGIEGQLFTVVNNKAETMPPPDGLQRSGVFCLTDAKDGKIWVANRGFIGRNTAAGWVRFGPPGVIKSALIAAPARSGGLWVYTAGSLKKFHANGTVENFPAAALDQPREMIEDRNGVIWIATIAHGVARFRPGGEGFFINATNGLTHNAIRCLLEDREGNLWVGGSLNGLNRLKPRQFVTIGRPEGLPDNIVRTIAETAPGRIVVGMHGGGIAQIQDGQVMAAPRLRHDAPGQYVWSLLHDRTGRLWIGTFNDGLFLEEDGARRPVLLPEIFGDTISVLKEDVQGRIWAGGPRGLGIIEGNAMTTYFTNSVIDGVAITCLAENAQAGKIWIGTYTHGLIQIDARDLSQVAVIPGLPGKRISSLTQDQDGYLWIGLFERGLACLHDGKLTLIGPKQGLPEGTVGSLLDDHRGSFWLGTTHGILRVARAELQRVAQHPSPAAVFNLFNVSDGLGSEYCVEGYQPNALRDRAGHLWFGTDGGVVTVDPAHLHINSNPPPVVIENISFIDRSGNRQVLDPRAGQLLIPPGGIELKFDFAALSYTAPEKINFKYRLEGANENWVEIGNQHDLQLHELPPGNYVLRLTAANNDGVWNGTGSALAFVMQPFIWQTLWFRLFALVAVAGGGGLIVWRLTRRQFHRRIESLQQQRRFEQERARLATIMENTSDLVVFADCNGGVIHLNPSGRKLIGLTGEENLHGLKLTDLQPAWAAEKVASEGIPAARQSGTWEAESALKHRNGREIPVSLVVILHKDSEGQDSFISAIARDITERKHAEAELQRREKYFRWLIEHASDSITVVNPAGVILYQSSSSKRILGYPAEALLGRNLSELVHPEDLPNSLAGLSQALAHPDVPATMTVRLRHLDETWRTIQIIGTSTQAETGDRQIVLNARDLTDNLKLEAQLRQAQKMEAVGQLAGGVAHDFNNILTALRLQAELLGMAENLPESVREGLLQICADTNRAADLTRQLLLFSRRQVMQSRLLDLNQIVKNVSKMLQRIIREDVRLLLHLHPVPLMTFADASMLDQVLINLAVNARDAMPDGGLVRIETSQVTVGPAEVAANPEAAPGRYVCVSVSDQGGGIPPEILPRIFDPFFTTKEAGRGTGLGLATVFGIVKQHQGWIRLDNRPGQGVTFHVHLPASAAKPTTTVAATSKVKPRGGTETILLVEDEEAVRKPTRMILERNGYRVLEAADGTEALKIWKEHREEVSLLLSDLVMPGPVGGRELGRQLKAERPGLKVLFASGYSADIAGRDFQLQPGEAFIQKPFITEQILAAVRKCLDS